MVLKELMWIRNEIVVIVEGKGGEIIEEREKGKVVDEKGM